MDREKEIARWRRYAVDGEVAAQLEALLEANDQAAIADAFFRDLEFGTGGLRGILGAGTNRMNIYTVGKATQGLADYINRTAEEDIPSVAIARDSRNNGELFVRTAACVLAANGIRVHLYPRIEPTPALSFAVRDLQCSAGICMTASHNPAVYNGYKVYGADGCQITSTAAAGISQAISEVDAFSDVRSADFEKSIRNGMIDWIEDGTIDRFIDAVCSLNIQDPDAADTAIRLVYTPLNGTGLECMERMLPRIGMLDTIVVPEQKMPDGNFPTCPYPNPEIREALQKGIDLCHEVRPDLLLATDPDADRVGVAVEDNGEYVLLTGNEMGILLLDYICRMRTAQQTMPDEPLVISTIVSTVMIDAIAGDYNVQVMRTLTGFKYIGETITHLEALGHADRFLLGFEESYGYLTGTHVRDKDSIDASMLICQMAQHYKKQGMNLAQAMESLYEKYGYYRNRTLSVSFPGADGAQKMTELMAALRKNPPSELAGMKVLETIDYQNGYDGLPNADVIEFSLPDTNKIVFRPSGTEPKIKAYLFSKGPTAEKAQAMLDTLESAARNLIG